MFPLSKCISVCRYYINNNVNNLKLNQQAYNFFPLTTVNKSQGEILKVAELISKRDILNCTLNNVPRYLAVRRSCVSQNRSQLAVQDPVLFSLARNYSTKTCQGKR